MPRPLILCCCVLLGAMPFLAGSLLSPATADDSAATPSTVYVNVSGEAAAAKAWFDGAPPSGLPLQDALDRFNAEGYRVRTVTDPYMGAGGQVVWALLMERGE